jgi:hypothetical protein
MYHSLHVTMIDHRARRSQTLDDRRVVETGYEIDP